MLVTISRCTARNGHGRHVCHQMELCRTGMRDRSGLQEIKSAADVNAVRHSRRRLLDTIHTKGRVLSQ
jgi:hypothetical protein